MTELPEPPARDEIVDVDTARAEYAKWFVKRHYLKKSYCPSWRQIAAWNRATDRGYIRFRKLTWPADSTLYPNEVHDCEEFGRAGYDYIGMSTKNQPVESWWHIQLKDLDQAVNDDHEIAKSYRRYREHTERMKVYEYLLAEAEYHVLVNEAWLRAYGVEVERTE